MKTFPGDQKEQKIHSLKETCFGINIPNFKYSKAAVYHFTKNLFLQYKSCKC